MAKDQQMTNQQSLEIIQQMIAQAKTNITDSGFGWLLWGTMIFLTCISTYIFIDIGSENIFLGWNIFGLITVILLTYDIIKHKKKQARTYVDDLLKLVDIGFIICLFTIIISINVAVSPNSGFGFFLMIFAFLMLIKGGVVKSNSLIIGAVVNWAGAIAIFINKEFRYDMLIMAAAVLIGYIIPGLQLRSKYRKSIPGNNIR
ncbi:MAG: hypothetical protein KBF74_09440 [Ferruginibacter sp.]|jgi:hypothetical protein|nr:hypothetical protein [Ferruginibacter sp.]